MAIKIFYLPFKILLYYIFVVTLIVIFLFIRLNNISNSLEFFGDIGRDHLVLFEWWTTGKIPLLGPGLSYFSLHLPPIYFYLNYPIFLISRFSAYSTLITLLFLYISVFLVGIINMRKKEYKIAVLIIAALIIFNPQYILQTRLPWNLTFAAPFLGIAIFMLLFLKEKYSIYKIIIFSGCLSIALGLSAESIPAVIVILVSSIFLLPHRLKNFICFLATTLLVFLPLIVFELRHEFFFTLRLIANPITQPFEINVVEKFPNLLSYILGINSWDYITVLIAASIFFIFVSYFIWQRKKAIEKDNAGLLFVLFCACFILHYLLPFPVREYDIFGPTILLFSAISFLPLRFSLVIYGLLLILWVNPNNFNNYFRLGHRTVTQMEECARYICRVERDPMYISTQAWYSYHKTPEYQFMFNKNNCRVTDITSTPNWSDKMIVIADNETYEHGKTKYNELTLFGKSNIEKEYNCGDQLKAYILQKI